LPLRSIQTVYATEHLHCPAKSFGIILVKLDYGYLRRHTNTPQNTGNTAMNKKKVTLRENILQPRLKQTLELKGSSNPIMPTPSLNRQT
jgi:hypothetical protein